MKDAILTRAPDGSMKVFIGNPVSWWRWAEVTGSRGHMVIRPLEAFPLATPLTSPSNPIWNQLAGKTFPHVGSVANRCLRPCFAGCLLLRPLLPPPLPPLRGKGLHCHIMSPPSVHHTGFPVISSRVPIPKSSPACCNTACVWVCVSVCCCALVGVLVALIVTDVAAGSQAPAVVLMLLFTWR